jgi:hypothetical protein
LLHHPRSAPAGLGVRRSGTPSWRSALPALLSRHPRPDGGSRHSAWRSPLAADVGGAVTLNPVNVDDRAWPAQVPVRAFVVIRRSSSRSRVGGVQGAFGLTIAQGSVPSPVQMTRPAGGVCPLCLVSRPGVRTGEDGNRAEGQCSDYDATLSDEAAFPKVECTCATDHVRALLMQKH